MNRLSALPHHPDPSFALRYPRFSPDFIISRPIRIYAHVHSQTGSANQYVDITFTSRCFSCFHARLYQSSEIYIVRSAKRPFKLLEINHQPMFNRPSAQCHRGVFLSVLCACRCNLSSLDVVCLFSGFVTIWPEVTWIFFSRDGSRHFWGRM